MERLIIEKNRYYFLRRKKLTLSFGLILLTLLKSHFPDRKVWIKHWIARRRMQGAHHNLFMELQLEDPMKYRRCLRMNSDLFETLVNKVTPLIVKKDTHLRKAISPAERLLFAPPRGTNSTLHAICTTGATPPRGANSTQHAICTGGANKLGHFSIVLLALVDAHLRFIFVDVGTNGRIGDSGVWNKCH
ncbi:Inclusion body clearance protein iml2, partial [Frankliniella fusca]